MHHKLRTFITVTEMESFSRAAKALNLSQPAVSKQMSFLSSYYQVELFERVGRQISLTEAGEAVYRYAINVVESEARLRKTLRDLSDTIKGTLVIGASTVPGQYILPHFIGAFLRRYPCVRLRVLISDSQTAGKRLTQGEIDLAIVGTDLKEDGVVCRDLFDDEIVLVAPCNHHLAQKREVSLNELTDEPFIWREKGSATRQILEYALGNRLLQLNRIAEMGGTEAILSAVEAGAGLAFLSKWATWKSQKAGTLTALTLKEMKMRRKFYACYVKTRQEAGPAETFLEYLEKHHGSLGSQGQLIGEVSLD